MTLADLTAEPTVYDLFGHTYTVRPLTRNVKKKFEAADKKLLESEEEDDDKGMALLVAVVETLLEPVGEAPPVGKQILDAWKRDEVGVGQVRALYYGAQQAALARPT